MNYLVLVDQLFVPTLLVVQLHLQSLYVQLQLLLQLPLVSPLYSDVGADFGFGVLEHVFVFLG